MQANWQVIHVHDPYAQFYPLIEIVPSYILGFITLRAVCLILDLRSNRIYTACHLLNVTANIVAHSLGLPEFLRAFILNPSTSVFMPILYSRGPLKLRITRTLTLCFTGVVAETLSILTFMLLGHGAYYDHIDASNAADIALVYCITILSSGIACETIVVLCQRHDGNLEANFGTPVLVFLFVCFVFANFMVVRLTMRIHNEARTYLFVGLALIASLVYGFLCLDLARRDAAAKRIIADSTARMRQERHVIARINEGLRQNESMRHLRHDLANQMDVVSELATKGYTTQADRYLSALQSQASRLTEENHA